MNHDTIEHEGLYGITTVTDNVTWPADSTGGPTEYVGTSHSHNHCTGCSICQPWSNWHYYPTTWPTVTPIKCADKDHCYCRNASFCAPDHKECCKCNDTVHKKFITKGGRRKP